MPNGGELKLETSNFYVDEEFASRYPFPVVIGDYVSLLNVVDNGIGMDASTRARSLSRSSQLRKKAKGLAWIVDGLWRRKAKRRIH